MNAKQGKRLTRVHGVAAERRGDIGDACPPPQVERCVAAGGEMWAGA
jgi:hypothetical protein